MSALFQPVLNSEEANSVSISDDYRDRQVVERRKVSASLTRLLSAHLQRARSSKTFILKWNLCIPPQAEKWNTVLFSNKFWEFDSEAFSSKMFSIAFQVRQLQISEAVLPMLVNLETIDSSYLTFDSDNLPNYVGNSDPSEVSEVVLQRSISSLHCFLCWMPSVWSIRISELCVVKQCERPFFTLVQI